MKKEYIILIILIVVLIIVWKKRYDEEKRKEEEEEEKEKTKEQFPFLAVGIGLAVALGVGLGTAGGLGALGPKAAVTNKISNETLNRNTLESINQNVNEFVTNSVIKNAASCSSRSSNYDESKTGDVTMVGSDNDVAISMQNIQDASLSLLCIQQSIQQTNMANDIATSIMDNLTQKVSNNTLTKLIATSEAKNEQGMFANPFASSSSDVYVESTNIQENETNRKLANLISNRVANGVNVTSIQNCFTEVAIATTKKIGDIKVLGDENIVNIKLTGKQLSKSFSTCQQLVQQTSSVTNQILTDLGLSITDSTVNTISTESESTAVASVKTTGLEGVVGALAGLLGLAFLPSIISSSLIVGIIGFVLMAGGGKKGGKGLGKGKGKGLGKGKMGKLKK